MTLHIIENNNYFLLQYVVKGKESFQCDFFPMSNGNLIQYFVSSTYSAVLLKQDASTYTGGQVPWYSKFSGKHFCYFDHLSKRFQEQMIPHLKALI